MSDSSFKLLGAPPGRAVIVDVSARDGLQSCPERLTPEERAEWVRAILRAGVQEAEVGTFTSASRVPQMVGTDQVLANLVDLAPRLWVLVPNQQGLERAIAAGARNVVFLLSATESHSKANLGRPIDRVLSGLRGLAGHARGAGLRARLALSMVWVDPLEGAVPAPRVLGLCREARSIGFDELTLCDTYGGASPLAVAELIEALRDVFPMGALGLHLHNTFGTAAANTLVGLNLGVRRFDASVGGLGGCPFAPGARGNMATEDLAYLLGSLGVETGVDAEALLQAKEKCFSLLERHRV